MPKFGEAHKLLSSRHSDTSPPAGGADPSDGQLATWSDLLKGWCAADPTPVAGADHSLLINLSVDTHSQYALADKSRPDPWVSADDLYWCDISYIGVRHHHDLQMLNTDDHPVYINIAGRIGGQTVIGSPNPGEDLTLQGTSHATPGRVKVEDDLQLLSGLIRDPGGNTRLTLGTSSPEVALTGDALISKHLALGGSASIDTGQVLVVKEALATHPASAIYTLIQGTKAAQAQFTYGISGGAEAMGTPSIAYVYGLYFYTSHKTTSPTNALGGIAIQIQSNAAGSGALAIARGFYLSAGYWGNAIPVSVIGMDIEEQGHASTSVAEGLHIDDQTGTTVRLLELGPAVPYLRLAGGANPAANQSHLSLKFGATLKLLTEGAAGSGGAGFRQVIVPN